MLHDHSKLKETQDLVYADFELEPLSFEGEDAFNKFRNWLSEAVDQMMNQDFERFIQVLYRLDIPENKAIAALNNQLEAAAPEALADLIIQREQQKIKSRAWYRERMKNQSLEDDDWL